MNEVVQKTQTDAFLPGLAFSSTACFNGDKENERQLKCSCCGFGIQAFSLFFSDRYHLQPQFIFPLEQAAGQCADCKENSQTAMFEPLHRVASLTSNSHSITVQPLPDLHFSLHLTLSAAKQTFDLTWLRLLK